MGKTPALSADEAERLAALYRLKILDTPAEERFDRLTRLGTSLFRVPICYLSLIDSERQWFKSSCGLSTCGVSERETSRAVSFCTHTIMQDNALVVTDATRDSRFAGIPLVTGAPFIRFYAGYPLSVPSATGSARVGTFCLADTEPRGLSDRQMEQLRDLALLAEDQLNLLDVAVLQEGVLEAKRAVEEARRELELKNALLQRVFGCYVTEDVARQALRGTDVPKLGGRRQCTTIMMSDLRGFTPLSECMAPEHVVEVLNRYLTCMVDTITRYGGRIDAFIGDAILVEFGERDDHAPPGARRAVACAIEMQLQMEAVNAENRRRDLPELAMGIGITTGDVVAGNIGSPTHMKYSIIGSPVNQAARIESLTMGGQVLISRAVLDKAGRDLRIDGALRVMVKGVPTPIAIYDVGGIAGEYNLFLPESGCLPSFGHSMASAT